LTEFFQALLVLESVHTLPKAGVLVGQQGLLLNQPPKGFAHQFLTGTNVAKDLMAHCEEATVDPNVAAGQPPNPPDPSVGVGITMSKLAVGFTSSSEATALLCRNVSSMAGSRRSLSPSPSFANVSVGTGLDKRNRPVVDVAVQKVDLLPALRPNKIVGDRLVVMKEVVLNAVTLVPKTDNEVLVPKVGVVFHQVPQDWPRADLHHGFGYIVGVPPEPHTGSPAKQNYLHKLPPSR